MNADNKENAPPPPPPLPPHVLEAIRKTNVDSQRNLQSYDPEFHSPNEMVIDTPDELASAENEKEQVVDINPEGLENGPDAKENAVLATDCMFASSCHIPSSTSVILYPKLIINHYSRGYERPGPSFFDRRTQDPRRCRFYMENRELESLSE